MAESFKILGLAGVLDTLKQLPPEVVSKNGGPIRSALRKAAQVIQKEAQANVRRIVAEPNIGGAPSKSTGALEKSIKVTRGKMRGGLKGETALVTIPPIRKKYADTRLNRRKHRVGKIHSVSPLTYYAWFLEFGTERMRPHPFMQPAFMSKKGEAVNVFVQQVTAKTKKIIQKLEAANRGKS